jgi:hypothetical protein
MEDAAAMGRLAGKLMDKAYDLRDAIEAAQEGHRGHSIDVEHEVNKILLPTGWKLVRAEKVTVFR